MKRLIALVACLALLVPLFVAPMPAMVSAQDMGRFSGPQSALPLGFDRSDASPFDLLDEARRNLERNQVRIQQRVIIRVSPAPSRERAEMLANLPRREMPRSFQEVEHDDCVDISDIMGVQPTRDNRLLFFTNNRQILAASLERSCVASAFYSGFYIEQNEDGRLCVSRDQLQSRAGAACEVSSFTRLVAASQ